MRQLLRHQGPRWTFKNVVFPFARSSQGKYCQKIMPNARLEETDHLPSWLVEAGAHSLSPPLTHRKVGHKKNGLWDEGYRASHHVTEPSEDTIPLLRHIPLWRPQSIRGATGLADRSHGRLAVELPRYTRPPGAFTMVWRSRMLLCASHAHTHTQVHSTQQLEEITCDSLTCLPGSEFFCNIFNQSRWTLL